jgi:hypothetical protein
MNLAKGAVKSGLANANLVRQSAADIIDELYPLAAFKDYRATLGGARDFAKEYRNIASHPSRTAKQAIDKIRKCRTGFIDSIRHSKNLCNVLQRMGYATSIHTT